MKKINTSRYSVDILLATYNGERYLQEQVESLFAQTYNDFRVIARDDGSSDTTPHILNSYHDKYGERFIVINNEQPTGSAKENFSRLSELSSAPYVMYCDQDDYWYPQKLETTLAAMQQAERRSPDMPVLVHCDLKVVDAQRHVLAESLWRYQGLNPAVNNTRRLIVQNNVTGCCVMVNRALLTQALPIPKSVLMHDWWLALVASVTGRIVAVDVPLMDYRQHGANDTGAKNYSLGYVARRIYRQLFTERFSQSRKMIEQTRQQAEALVAVLGPQLNEVDRCALIFYVNLAEYGYLLRRFYMLRYGILKQGIFRNIALIVTL